MFPDMLPTVAVVYLNLGKATFHYKVARLRTVSGFIQQGRGHKEGGMAD